MTRVVRLLKWFAPGMRIKRWLMVAFLGLLLFCTGVLLGADYIAERLQQMAAGNFSQRRVEALALMASGSVIMLIGLRRFFTTLSSAVSPYQKKELVEVLYDRRYLDQGLKIVAIGGGTGLSTLLRGLKTYSSNLVAVVTVSDDGGSSGKLRQDLGMLPPGDIRNCLTALADDESLLKELFSFRFKEGGLEGHSFGNLFLAALTELAGDFEVAVRLSSQILATRGRVLPATLSKCQLCGRFPDGTVVCGESAIPRQGKKVQEVFLEPAECDPPEEVLHAIGQADAIVLGPGSLYTSVIPNLLVRGMVDALRASKAPKIYVCNVMTQPGETDDMGAADHLEVLTKHTGLHVDYAVVNLADPSKLKDKYRAEGAIPVDPQFNRLAEMLTEAVGANLISETEMVRHDPDRLGRTIVDLVARHRGKDAHSSKESSSRLRVVK